jgi:xanthine dehydrogenase accessory factor
VSLQREFLDEARTGGRAALVTVVGSEPASAPRVGSRMLVRADGRRSGSLGSPDLDEAAAGHADELLWAERSELREEHGVKLFVDVTAPAPRLVIVGAVELARALCRIARASGWRPFVADPRSRFATAARFPEAEGVVADWPEAAFQQLGGFDRATYVAILTHDPKVDGPALVVALRSEAAYVGALGSRRVQGKRRERLLAAGFEERDVGRLSAPIGLDLGGVSAEEIALAIMAEMVAVRHGRGGGRLADAHGRIHEVPA